MRDGKMVYVEDVKEALGQLIELSNADRVRAIGAVNRVPEAMTVGKAELGDEYQDEWFGYFADCKKCGCANIIPSRFCGWCGRRLPDFEKYSEND